jgi:hypothetical protein
MAGEVRVNWTRRTLQELQRRVPASYPQVLARIEPRHRAAIDEAGLLAWLPCEHHLALCVAVRAELGDTGLIEHFCQTTLAAGDLPLFRGFAQAALRLFGASPSGLLRAGPQAWKTIFRDLGSIDVLDAPDAASAVYPHAMRVLFRITPPQMHVDHTFALGLPGGIEACLRLVERPGEVERHDRAYVETGALEFVVRW